jgi:hypothetical protein
LCSRDHVFQFDDAASIEIATQWRVQSDQPDIWIRTSGNDKLAFVEVKHDSLLGPRQLERYRDRLLVSGAAHTSLVLLTRSRASLVETTLRPEEYHHACWYDVYNWLAAMNSQHELCTYFIHNFMEFLEAKDMSMLNVMPDYQFGIPALNNLMKMLSAALVESAPGVKLKYTGGWNWRGYQVERKYFCGVRYDRHLVVVFENNKGNSPTYKQDFDLVRSGFLNLNKDEQFERLIQFLREAYKQSA